MEDEEKIEERFVDLFPVYTSHTFRSEKLSASYRTCFFGIFTLARYSDSKGSSTSLCLCEPLRWLNMNLDNKQYTDSLDELVEEIHQDRNKAKRVRFRF